MKKIFLIFLLSSIFYLLPSSSFAATITVCTTGGCDFSGPGGIQEAVNKAKDGDTVSVAGGDYNFGAATVTDANINCLVDINDKKITLQGSGNASINNGNYGLDDMSKANIGICVFGGEVTISSLRIYQTLRQGIYLNNAKAIIKNVTFLDVDTTSVEVRNSQAMILNNVIAAPGIVVTGNSYVRIENNTMFGGGIALNLCDPHNPTADIANNIMVNGNVSAQCPEQTAKVAKLNIKNNFVYKAQPVDGCVNGGSAPSEDNCSAGELCADTKFGWPGFIGADDSGTVCVYGEGLINGSMDLRSSSPAKASGAGYTSGPCATGNCQQYIASHPLPDAEEEQQNQNNNNGTQTTANTGQSFGYQVVNSNILPTQFMGKIKTINLPFIGLKNQSAKKDVLMEIFYYVLFSLFFYTIYYFAFHVGGFNFFLSIIFIVLGGAIGIYLGSWIVGLAIALILNLLFM